MSRKSSSSSIRTCRAALSTIASGVGPPWRSRSSFSREPPFTPMRIGTARSFAARTTSATRRALPMLPGLRRTPATPASIARRARTWLKWMSATTGMVTDRAMSARFAAASSSGTATRTMSQPAACSSRHWATVASRSRVSAVVIDWTETGASPPMATAPRRICRQGLRPARGFALSLPTPLIFETPGYDEAAAAWRGDRRVVTRRVGRTVSGPSPRGRPRPRPRAPKGWPRRPGSAPCRSPA